MNVVLAAVLPNDTTAPVTKFEPLIVTRVPPEVLPLLGETGFEAANWGAGAATCVYVNPPGRVADCPSGF
jgi:hypothetical protein